MAGFTFSWPALREGLISIDETNSTRPPDALTVVSLLYIALPNLIFLGGWLKLPYAIIAVALIVASFVQFLREARVGGLQQPYSASALLLIAALSFAWSSLGGAGHFFNANSDWHVRDTVLADLSLTSWPPSYGSTNGEHMILRSAIAYFLPAAALAKVAGMGCVDMALYLWTALGACLFLLLLPLPRRGGWHLLLMLIVVIFFSGMDFAGIVLTTGDMPIFPLRLEWWVPFSYSSLTGQLYWGPNHALAIWLTTALFYRHWGHPTFPALITLLLPLLVVWTPFAVVGILPFVVIAVLRWFSVGRTFRAWNLSLLQITSAILLTLFMLRLLTLGIGPIPSGTNIEVVAKARNGFALNYLVFVLMEFAILALLLAREMRHSWGLFWLACAILTLLPFFTYGPSNDAMLRLSTPCLLMLLILALDRINAWAARPSLRQLPASAWAIGIVLLIGAATPFNEMWRAATFRHTLPNYAMSLLDVQNGRFVAHYIGKLDRPELQALLRPPAPVSVGVGRLESLQEVTCKPVPPR